MTLDPAALTKFVSVQRSDRAPTLYWWSLPLGLGTLARLFADQLPGARAVVIPDRALGAASEALHARELPGGAALVADVAALLAARDAGRVQPCTIAVFPPTTRDEDLHERSDWAAALERLPFTIAIQPEGDGRARHRFCLRVPGKVIAAIEHLALDRGFGGNPGQVEMALLQGLALRPKHTAHLQLVLRDGGAKLVRIDGGGRRRVTLLESGQGYTGVTNVMPLADALRERVREAKRRFPVGVVMFIGLPFFIASFWLASWVRGGARAESAARVDGRGPDAAPADAARTARDRAVAG